VGKLKAKRTVLGVRAGTEPGKFRQQYMRYGEILTRVAEEFDFANELLTQQRVGHRGPTWEEGLALCTVGPYFAGDKKGVGRN